MFQSAVYISSWVLSQCKSVFIDKFYIMFIIRSKHLVEWLWGIFLLWRSYWASLIIWKVMINSIFIYLNWFILCKCEPVYTIPSRIVGFVGPVEQNHWVTYQISSFNIRNKNGQYSFSAILEGKSVIVCTWNVIIYGFNCAQDGNQAENCALIK